MANPWEFLNDWARAHVDATAYDDEPAARQAGLSAAAVIKAAGGNPVSFMLSELDSAASREVD